MKCKKRSKIKWFVIGAIVLLVLFMLVSLIVPTLFQTHTVKEGSFAEIPKNTEERVRCIDDNQDALLWRLRVMESAEKELIFTTFSYQNDEAGRDMMAAILHAAERGVHVRVLVDGFCGFTGTERSRLFRALADTPNVEIRFYNPVNFLQPWKLNYRMHDKYIVADDHVYILGGRNTKNLSLGEYQEKRDVDRDVLVYNAVPDENSSLQQVKDYFETVWNLPDTKVFAPGKTPDEKALSQLRTRYDQLAASYPEAVQPCDWETVTLETEGITLLHNPVQAGNKRPTLWAEMMDYMANGKDVLIQTPYIMCNRNMYEDLHNLTQNGRQITLLTNAIESGANLMGCSDYINEKEHIHSVGAVTYEYMGDCSVHAKTVLIDDHLSLVGSFNCDMRSAYLDTELMLAIESKELNAQLRETAEKAMEQSRRVAADGTVTLGANCPNLPLKPAKRILYGLVRYLILPVRHLL